MGEVKGTKQQHIFVEEKHKMANILEFTIMCLLTNVDPVKPV